MGEVGGGLMLHAGWIQQLQEGVSLPASFWAASGIPKGHGTQGIAFIFFLLCNKIPDKSNLREKGCSWKVFGLSPSHASEKLRSLDLSLICKTVLGEETWGDIPTLTFYESLHLAFNWERW